MTKRILSLFFALALFFALFTGCSEETSSGSSSSGPVRLLLPASAAPQSESDSSSARPGGGTSPIDILKQGVYVLGYTINLSYPDFEYTLKVVIAENGDDYLFQSEGEIPLNGYLKTRYMEKDGISYYIDDSAKTYSTGMDEYGVDDAMLELSGIGDLLQTGEEEFNGSVCAYEEYETETGPMRFYFNERGELVGMKGIAQSLDSTLENEMFGEAIILVDYLSATIPPELFEIPSDYRLID